MNRAFSVCIPPRSRKSRYARFTLRDGAAWVKCALHYFILCCTAPAPAPIAIGVEPGTYSLLNLEIISG